MHNVKQKEIIIDPFPRMKVGQPRYSLEEVMEKDRKTTKWLFLVNKKMT